MSIRPHLKSSYGCSEGVRREQVSVMSCVLRQPRRRDDTRKIVLTLPRRRHTKQPEELRVGTRAFLMSIVVGIVNLECGGCTQGAPDALYTRRGTNSNIAIL